MSNLSCVYTAWQGQDVLKKLEIFAMPAVFTFFKLSTPWDALTDFLFLLDVDGSFSFPEGFVVFEEGTVWEISCTLFDSRYFWRGLKLGNNLVGCHINHSGCQLTRNCSWWPPEHLQANIEQRARNKHVGVQLKNIYQKHEWINLHMLTFQ